LKPHSITKEFPIRPLIPLLLLAVTSISFAQTPTFGGCTILPANNVWNARVDSLPVDPNSAAYIASINATNNKLHPDFGHGGGMPYNLVNSSTPKYSVPFYYNGDAGPYPIPANVNIQGGSDHHAILIDTSTCVLYEIFNLSGKPGSWRAGSGAIFPLNSNALRPPGWTSADAAGLPIFPGEIRYDEILAGKINHALRLTVDHTRNKYIWPARHYASALTGSQYPPMGQRFRLKASFNIAPYPKPVQVILQAAKTYGLILADNGTSWHLTGLGDTRYDDTVMHTLTQVTGDNFEAINESSLMVDPNSMAVRTSGPVPSGWVHLVSKNSGKCAAISGGPSATWQTIPAQQQTCGNAVATNQYLQFIPVTGGYEIKVKSSGLALETFGDGNGAVIEQWPFEKKSNQIWQVVPTSDGYFAITPLSNTRAAIDVKGVSKLDGAALQLWTSIGSDNQKWRFVPVN
jgi:Ricin-type beta-trefoil lectin domain-like